MNNIFHILKWDAQRNLNLLRNPVDKGKDRNIHWNSKQNVMKDFSKCFFILSHSDTWSGAQPAVVNAFYNPNKNDIGKEHNWNYSKRRERIFHYFSLLL